MKIKFLYFENVEGNRFSVAYMPGYFYSEVFDDLIIKLEIIDNKINLTVVPDDWITIKEIKEINKMLKGDIESWEFFDFSSTPNLEKDLWLVSDRPSKMHRVINSKKNIQNIENFKKNFEKW